MTAARRALAVLAVAIALIARSGFACPCGDSASGGGPLTGSVDRFAVLAGQSLSLAHGAWNADGRYTRLDTDQGTLLVMAAGAYRPFDDLEASLELTLQETWLRFERFETEDSGFGDTRARLWWDAVDEPMPYERLPWPAVSAYLWLRAPTGVVDATSGQGGSLGASGAGQGLGTWEAALGARLQKGFMPHFRVAASGEAALRLPDDELGFERKLGPRALAQLSGQYFPSADVDLGLATSLAWEGEVAVEGRRRDGTAQRLWTVGATTSYTPPRTALRLSLLVDVAPPVDSVSANALGSVRIGWSLAYVD